MDRTAIRLTNTMLLMLDFFVNVELLVRFGILKNELSKLSAPKFFILRSFLGTQ